MLEKSLIVKIGHFFKPARTIPRTSWTAHGRWDLGFRRVAILIFGLLVFGFGDACLINSHIGNAPWSVLAQGIHVQTGIPIGVGTFAIGTVVLMLWWPLREKPGFGTLMNILFIAIAIQIGVDYFPNLHSNLLLQILYCFLGVGLVGLGSSLYITCGLGPGPRDGLMTALHHRTGIRVGRVRLCIEIVAFLIGWALGGTVGIGTAIFALFIGNSVAINLNLIVKLSNRLGRDHLS